MSYMKRPGDRVTYYSCDYSYPFIGWIAPRGYATYFAYNAFQGWTKIRDALGNCTYFLCDDYGRATRVTDPLGNYTYHTYDSRGNETELTDAEGAKWYFEYDGLRLVSFMPAEPEKVENGKAL